MGGGKCTNKRGSEGIGGWNYGCLFYGCNSYFCSTHNIVIKETYNLELAKTLAALGDAGGNLKHVEAHGLRERPALAHGDGVTIVAAEGRGDVRRQVLVTLLVTLVLGDEVKVVTTNDNGALHLGGLDHTVENAAADGNIAGEGALLVDVVALDCLLGGLEPEPNVLVPAGAVLARGLPGDHRAVNATDHALLLESLLILLRHGCKRDVKC
eukprot:376498-Prorocentrum_minimum.AAC.6